MAAIDGTHGLDTLTGTAGADVIGARDGADRVEGGAGNDVISAGGGADTVSGGLGDDVIYGYGSVDRAADSGIIRATRVATGLDDALFAGSPPGDPDRLFVVEQHTGAIRILDLETGQLSATPFLDLPASALSSGSEQGLLGLAFHPDYASNGRFYVNLTNAAGDTEIWEYERSADPDVADAGSKRLIVRIDQPYSNHNGGWMDFGPDGLLYVASGDGGSGGDPGNRAQNIDSLLGKILRIDVDGDDFATDPNRNYAIPEGNPFVGRAGADEVWALGLRNPWRMSFDSATGDLYIGDVGQGAREEIDYVPAGQGAGWNFGWKVREGTLVYDGDEPGNPDPDDPSLVDPVVDYGHGSGAFQGYSVTGGYVYHGPGGGDGLYFFADFVTDHVWTLRMVDGKPVDFLNRDAQIVTDAGTLDSIASFAVDGRGRLYAVGLDGEVFRLTPSAAAADGADTLNGGGGGDRIHGGAGADLLGGDDGNDSLYGGMGGDRLRGGAGDDFLAGGVGADALDGGLGFDTAGWRGAAGGVTVNLATGVQGGEALGDTLTSIEQVRLSDHGDRFTGGAGADFAHGYRGADTLYGGDGDDVLSGGVGADLVDGGNGLDSASFRTALSSVTVNRVTGSHAGSAEGDRFASIERFLMSDFADGFTGGTGGETVYGYGGGDALNGGGGNDWLHGGTGADRLTGGAGADRFAFKWLADSTTAAPDRILDFSARAGDRIDLSAIDADTGTAGDQAFRFVDAFSGEGGEALLTYDAAANRSTLRLDVDGGAADFTLLIEGQVGSGSGWVL